MKCQELNCKSVEVDHEYGHPLCDWNINAKREVEPNLSMSLKLLAPVISEEEAEALEFTADANHIRCWTDDGGNTWYMIAFRMNEEAFSMRLPPDMVERIQEVRSNPDNPFQILGQIVNSPHGNRAARRRKHR